MSRLFKVGDIITGLYPRKNAMGCSYTITTAEATMRVEKLINQPFLSYRDIDDLQVRVIKHSTQQIEKKPIYYVCSKWFKLVEPVGPPIKGLAYQVYLQEKMTI
jgi:hypothetical protein